MNWMPEPWFLKQNVLCEGEFGIKLGEECEAQWSVLGVSGPEVSLTET
jgi:hypothetical protein